MHRAYDINDKGTRIRSIDTVIADVPLKRSHFHATGIHSAQSYVFVIVKTEDGAQGIGEGVTPGGGAFWGGESVETIKTVIDRYLSPAVVGLSVFAQEDILSRMDRAAAYNNFAKAAVDMAVHDAAARMLNLPISAFFGGAVRRSIPVLWALATAQLEADVEDARDKFETRGHRLYKVKIGKGDSADEVRRAVRTAELIMEISSKVRCTVDVNQAWDEPTAQHALPVLERAGFALIEQPIPAWNTVGMSRLCHRLDIPIMADEGLWDFHDVYIFARDGATDVVGVKVAKGGGLRRAHKKAAVAEAAGLPLWGGMALESSIGTAASLQLFSALPALSWGCELIGPLLIADDFANESIRYSDGEVFVPDGAGIGVTLDYAKLEHYRRK
jgi:muconate/chloromuconate cycloisomerase